MPRNAEARARARMLEDVCDTLYDAINWSVMVVSERADEDSKRAIYQIARDQVNQINSWLEKQLDTNCWFGGPEALWADICVYPLVNSAASQGNKPPPGGRLEEWLNQMRKRQSARRVRDDIRNQLKTQRVATEDSREPDNPMRRRTFQSHRLEWMMRNGGKEIVLKSIAEGTADFSDWTL